MLVHLNSYVLEKPAPKGTAGCSPVLSEFYVFLPQVYHNQTGPNARIGLRKKELVHFPPEDPRCNLFHSPSLSSLHCSAFVDQFGDDGPTSLSPLLLGHLIDAYGTAGGCVLDLFCGRGLAIAGAH